LVREYTREAALMCPWIDEVLVDPDSSSGTHRLVEAVRAGHHDAVVTLFSTIRVGYACWRAGIPYRIAPATKLSQVFYNRRLSQRRSRSEKPEWAYNLELAAALLRDYGTPAVPALSAPYLSFPKSEIASLREQFRAAHGITASTGLVFVHPGSGGSAVNLSLAQYAHLLYALSSTNPLAFVISAGPGEGARAAELAGMLPSTQTVVYVSELGLVDFARHIASADLFISGSTGPLHVAGALDVPTAAFYPRRLSATPLRWQTLNSPERRLAFAPPEAAEERDMSAIDLNAAAAEISRRFLR
jgi:ADP-heptose:LPS heptosyltransferase